MLQILRRIPRWSVVFFLVVVIFLHWWFITDQHLLLLNVPFGLKPLDPSNFCNQSKVKCVDATVANISFPICVHEVKDDRYGSLAFLRRQYPEADLITKILNLMKHRPDLTFVDLGANIGSYCLPMAHAGIQVVAFEPNKRTLPILTKSICQGKIEHKIDLFNCALSNVTGTSFLKFDADNSGNTYLVGDLSCPGCLSTEITVLNNFVPFMKNKKVIFKVDTQETEILIFQERSAGIFFDMIDVLMVQIEWGFYPQHYTKNEADRRRVDRFVDFFYQRGYDVYDPRTEKKVDSNWEKWPYDIMFKKKSLPADRLFLI